MPNPVTDKAVEKAAAAAHDAMPWVYGQDDDGEDVYKPWSEAPEAVKQHYRDEILAAAPHLLAVEREARGLVVGDAYRRGVQDGKREASIGCPEQRERSELPERVSGYAPLAERPGYNANPTDWVRYALTLEWLTGWQRPPDGHTAVCMARQELGHRNWCVCKQQRPPEDREALRREDFEEAQRLIREGDQEGLAEFASRGVKGRAEEAARQAREFPLRSAVEELADLRTVIEQMPREEDGTATIMEVAQRRATALEYVERMERALSALDSEDPS
jgi:hypothetical protein